MRLSRCPLTQDKSMITCMYVGVTAGRQGELGERPSTGGLLFEPLIHQADASLKHPRAHTDSLPAVLRLSLTFDLPAGCKRKEGSLN